MTRLAYGNNCVNWPRRYVDALTSLCDTARQIDRRTFIRRVDQGDLSALEFGFGYSRHGLRMNQDAHVTYWSGKLWGHRVYFFTWSAIEYVFAPAPVLERIKL